eukprot:TRINITY_DN26559_c0_g1_i1.p2 TRINITY_DN26559_c0_g1~~TRINITY_DN26559_c0_g1_i1.p2  ORF type:complete len:211 (-),score=81.11 TRINITY_DN26559_c0_g1_i1:870-1502(-)
MWSKISESLANTANMFLTEAEKFVDKQILFDNDPEEVDVPWVKLEDKEAAQLMRTQLLSISASEEYFTTFESKEEFDMQKFLPTAKAMMEADPKLDVLRYKLVPRRVLEITFWQAYACKYESVLDGTFEPYVEIKKETTKIEEKCEVKEEVKETEESKKKEDVEEKKVEVAETTADEFNLPFNTPPSEDESWIVENPEATVVPPVEEPKQ